MFLPLWSRGGGDKAKHEKYHSTCTWYVHVFFVFFFFDLCLLHTHVAGTPPTPPA